ncbi:MAG: hypothetical protein H0W72_11130 [Planctomycetes bacterium]|nr:hypothetical protein [Planctomycetota bacterium]
MFHASSSCSRNAIGWLGVVVAGSAASYVLLDWLGRRRSAVTPDDEPHEPASQDDAREAAEPADAPTYVSAAVVNACAHSRRRGDFVDLDAELDETEADLVQR